MDQLGSLSHTRWECKYHVVFIPKYRRKALFGELRRYLGPVFRTLTEQKESRVEEGHLMPDHVHMMLSIPPKYAVSQIVGFIKGKSAIHIARTFGERKRNFAGEHFRASHPAVHPQPRGRRQAAGPTAPAVGHKPPPSGGSQCRS